MVTPSDPRIHSRRLDMISKALSTLDSLSELLADPIAVKDDPETFNRIVEAARAYVDRLQATGLVAAASADVQELEERASALGADAKQLRDAVAKGRDQQPPKKAFELSYDAFLAAASRAAATSLIHQLMDTRRIDSALARLTEVDQILNEAHKRVAERAAEEHVKVFVHESNTHRESAGAWLNWTIGAAFATIIAAIIGVAWAFVFPTSSSLALVHLSLAKVFVLSTLTLATLWCGRNYRAERHNEAVNRHRANALATFRLFLDGADDERTKDAVLLHATQAAFAPRPTGFDAPDNDGHSYSSFVEVLTHSAGRQNSPGT